MADIGVVDEDVDEPVELAVRTEQLGAQAGMGGDERGQDLADRRATDLHELLATGRDAQDRRDPDRAHRSNHASKAR
jgi:hypothetical protein